MAGLKLEHIYKVYPNGVKAVSDFTMEIEDQEFIVFVGPSGCGKSTTLRMIAGLEDISAGELYIDDRIVNDVEPKDRDIAMVFQNYALYPHMTVYENMAFGLQLRHVPTEEIHEKVLWAANILGLTEYLDRKPKAMSGGQRQRVALGRALLRNPKVMLLDEPLSNLDAKLRTQMRSEIAKLHQDLKTTFIYVTHDQVEAMTLGTRVVVMKSGIIQQIDTPKNLYDFPANKFVAGFIGTPQMNFFEATLVRNGNYVDINFEYSDNKLSVNINDLIKVQPHYLDGKHKVWVGVRCEDLSCDPEIVNNSQSVFDVKVSHFEELGNETLIYGDINMSGDGFKESSTRAIIKAPSTLGYKPGDVAKVAVNVNKIHFFDFKDENSIVPRIPTLNVIECDVNGNRVNFDGVGLDLPDVAKAKDGHGQLYIPIEALTIDPNGQLDVKVVKVENVDGQRLAYLKINERVLFLLVDESVQEGQSLKLHIDITNITIKNEEEVIVKTLEKYNSISGTFLNFATANSNEKNKYDGILSERIAAVNREYDQKVTDVKSTYATQKEEASRKDLAAIKAHNDQKIKELEDSTNAHLEEIKAKFKEESSKAKAEHKVNKKNAVDAVKAEYARQKEEENSSYKHFLQVNKDKDVYYKRKTEHQEFKENFPKQRENDINRALDTESINYESIINAIKANYKREKKVLKNNLKNEKINLTMEYNILKVLEKKEKEELSNLERERKTALLKAKQIFFIKINGYLYLSPDIISNKMIQGLGTKVFVKDFQIDIPNDKICVSDSGIKATVSDFLDYGEKKFLICEVKDEGSVKTFYVLHNEKLEKGTEVQLSFNLEDTRIIEKSMNLRIY